MREGLWIYLLAQPAMCDTLYPTHICTNNKRNRNAELITSFKTHLNKIISKG